MSIKKTFSPELLKLNNIEGFVNNIATKLKNDVFITCHKQGAIIGISGGIDSSVTLALTVKALGPDKVLGIMLPEKDSSSDSKEFALKLANKFSVETIEEVITGALEGYNCYKRRDEAVARVFPEYDPTTYKMKIGVNQTGTNQNLPPIFSLTIIDKDGNHKSRILPVKEYLQIVASSNFKQRTRMSMLYYHAEVKNYAVIGTPNKHEVEQGFFVKNGDSGADIMPIANLYKTQVYQIAEFLGVPNEIIERVPTSDTYSAEQTQEEFFFQFPFKEMDLLWYGYENGYSFDEVGSVMDKTPTEIELIFNNFKRKQKTTDYLRMSPIKDF
jgi:NAD+ synthase